MWGFAPQVGIAQPLRGNEPGRSGSGQLRRSPRSSGPTLSKDWVHLSRQRSRPRARRLGRLNERLDDETWETLGRWRTDEQGRVANLSPPEKSMTAGIYRMVFGTKEYFDGQGVSTFYPTIEVVFEIKNTDEHYHVPVLVSPFGYSTYRGS